MRDHYLAVISSFGLWKRPKMAKKISWGSRLSSHKADKDQKKV